MPGTFGGRKTEVSSVPLSAVPVEHVLYSTDGKASIVLGSDRASNAASGYGGLGFDDSSAIDLVCGRGKTISEEDKGPAPTSINPDFFSDAARIYMSEKTDLDANFSLAGGVIGNSIASSGIGLKADAIRIIGVTGIKLVTRANASNSNTSESGAGGIELIAGNDDSFLQPMVKGDNLAACLNEITEILSDVKGQVHSIMSFLGDFVNGYASHVHGPPGTPSPTAQMMFQIYGDEYMRHASEDNSISDAIVKLRLDYLEIPSQDKNILSPYNKTN